MSKDSLVKGTLILTVAAIVSRVLGVVQRIPLILLLGPLGMAPYGIAFSAYSLLLVVATAGLPSALSKMISERTALGKHAEADRIYQAAIRFALVAGVVMAALMYVAAPYYADLVLNPEAALSIQAIAPALLLFPLIAIMRGYFQGRQMMMPNGISQVVEQILRVITAIALAYILMDHSREYAAAGASFGGVAGSIAAAGVMFYYAVKLRRSDRLEREQEGDAGKKASRPSASSTPLSYRAIYAALFKLSVPIVIFSVTVTLIYAIDASIVTPLLKDQMGLTSAQLILGILSGQAQSMAGIPIILAIALSQSVVPIISAAYAKKEMQQVSAQTGKVLQLSLLSGLLPVLVIALAARPINMALFGNDEGLALVDTYAPPMIAALTATAIFQIVMQTSGAVLMGMGRMRPLVIGVLAGIVIKLAASFALASWFGIYGIIAGTALCFIVMTAINLRVLRLEVPFQVFSRRQWLGLIGSTLIVGLIGWGMDQLALAIIHPFGHARGDAFVQAVLVSAVIGVLYVLLLFAARVMAPADLAKLPGPLRKLAKPILARLERKAASKG